MAKITLCWMNLSLLKLIRLDGIVYNWCIMVYNSKRGARYDKWCTHALTDRQLTWNTDGTEKITAVYWGHLKLYFHLPLFPALLLCKIILPGPSVNSPSYQKWKSEKHSGAQKSMPDLIGLHVGSLENKAFYARIEIYVHLYACSTALKALIWPLLFMGCIYMIPLSNTGLCNSKSYFLTSIEGLVHVSRCTIVWYRIVSKWDRTLLEMKVMWSKTWLPM